MREKRSRGKSEKGFFAFFFQCKAALRRERERESEREESCWRALGGTLESRAVKRALSGVFADHTEREREREREDEREGDEFGSGVVEEDGAELEGDCLQFPRPRDLRHPQGLQHGPQRSCQPPPLPR